MYHLCLSFALQADFSCFKQCFSGTNPLTEILINPRGAKFRYFSIVCLKLLSNRAGKSGMRRGHTQGFKVFYTIPKTLVSASNPK